jgi:kumamolisin
MSRPVVALGALLASLLFSVAFGPALAGPPVAQLHGYVPREASLAHRQGEIPSQQEMRLSFVLPWRNQADLSELLHRIYDPKDPLYGHYLTPKRFAEEFGPSQSDIQAIAGFAASNGMRVADVTPDNMIVHVVGPATNVEKAFSVRLWTYTRADGRSFFAPSADPVLPAALAKRLLVVLGLDNAHQLHTHIARPQAFSSSLSAAAPHIGNGPQGSGLTPNDIKVAYNLKNLTLNQAGTTPLDGTGQTLGLYELDGYVPNDIQNYENQYSLPNVTLQNVAVDGGVGRPGGGREEVTLDIELMIALAPGMTKLLVYEAPNNNASVVDLIDKIATDDLATTTSTSWGNPEDSSPANVVDAENQALEEMAANGQSYFDASGDNGAFDDPSSNNPTVDDPAGQPFLTAVGGTTLSLNPDGTYLSETTWVDPSSGSGSGGGISANWPIPDYQTSVVNASSDTELSKTMRNVPDVSLNSDPNTGYSIFLQGSWQEFGGTSCAAPLWAAFTALVNQQRLANGGTVIGFINPNIYEIAQLPASYAADFHDIADNSTNLLYHAEKGYDLATGLGTFNGANLLFDPDMTLTFGATITGTVTTGSSSTPVQNAVINESLQSTGQVIQTATTAADGTYSIAAPVNTAVTLEASADGLYEQSPIMTQGPAKGQTLSNQDFTMLVSPHTFLNDGTPAGIQMVSSPFSYQAGLSMASILGAINVKAATWIPASTTNGSYIFAPQPPLDTFHLGQGYWIAVPSSTKFYSISQLGQPAASPFTIDLSPGWNMIGTPFNGAVANSGITVSVNGQPSESYATAVANNSVSDFFTWQGGDTAYETISASGSLQPWEGYWIFAQSPTTISLTAPP